jgi:hypothetical protein
VDELVKDKLEAQKEVKAKAAEEQDVVAQQVWLFSIHQHLFASLRRPFLHMEICVSGVYFGTRTLSISNEILKTFILLYIKSLFL